MKRFGIFILCLFCFLGCARQRGHIVYRNSSRGNSNSTYMQTAEIAQDSTQEEAVRLSFAHNQTAMDNPYVFGAEAFREKLEQISSGNVKVDVFNGTMTEDEGELFRKLESGEASIVVVSPGFLTASVPEVDVFSLNYLFDNFAHWGAVLDGEFGKSLSDIVAQKTGGKVRILGYWSAGVRDYYGKKPVYSPADLNGMTIRIGSSPVQQQFWKACGAIPKSVGWGALYDALNRGEVDSAENDYTNFSLKNHHKTTNGKFVCETEHDFTTRLMLVNGAFYDKLSAAQKKYLETASQYATQIERQKTFEQASSSKNKVIADGATVIENKDIDIDSFKSIAIPIQNEYAQKNGMERFIKLARDAR